MRLTYPRVPVVGHALAVRRILVAVSTCALASICAGVEPQPPNLASPSPVEVSVVERAPDFPDISTFLLGSGLALLIALLAWGEQIRAITRDTRDLERDFLELTRLSRGQLNAVLQAETVDDRLVAFTNLIASGKLTSASQVQILPLFERWRVLGTKLQSLQSKKYWFTIVLTVILFASGIAAALTPMDVGPLFAVLMPPSVLIIALLWIVIAAGRVEQKLNDVLKQIAEKV